jgi:integrase/recombinase XerD
MKNDTTDNKTLAQYIDRFLVNLEVLNKSPKTIDTARFRFQKLLDWCEMRSIENAEELTLQKLQSFQKHLARYKKRNGEKIIVATQHAILSTLKNFFNWMRRQGHLTIDPAENLDLPTLPAKTLPNKGLSPDEVERLFKSPNVSTKLGLRDRAMLAVFYSTGIRREELTILNVEDIDLEAKTLNVMIPTGIERVGILGENACEWLQRYIEESRPELDRGDAGKALFLNKNGDRMSAKGLSHTMKRIFEKAGVHKAGSTHLWRHTFCTKLMTDHCNPLVAQKLMGHQNLDYLMRYTDLDYKDLIKAHVRHHPAA